MDSDEHVDSSDILSTSSTVSSIFSTTSDVDLSSNYYNSNNNNYSITSSSSGEILKVSLEESGDGAGVTRRLNSDISSASSTVSSIFSTSDVELSSNYSNNYSITSNSSGEVLAPLKPESGDGAGVTTRRLRSDISSASSTVSSIFSTSDVDLSSNYSNSYSITSSSSGEILAPPLKVSPEESGDGTGVTTRQLNDISSASSTVSSIFSTSDVDLSCNYTNSYSITSSSSGDNLAAAVPLKLSLEELGDSAGLVTRRLKKKCVGKNKGVVWGFKSVIGRRKEMEDAVAVVPGFMTLSCEHVGGCTGSRGSGEILPVHFFGVYDGHGGSQVAKFCSERMHEVIAEEWDQDANDDCKWQQRWEAVMSSSFERADNEVTTEAVAPDIVGSTAVTVVLSGCQIIVSNCGDSRAVLCRGIETIPLTIDQKPDREDELLRIEAQDGKVINWNGARVFGVLAMSRSIGDHHLRPWVISVPEISFTTRTEDDECLIIASDGLWDVMTNNEVGEMARRIFRRRRRYAAAGESTAAQTLADSLTEIAVGRNSSDNISVIVVDLKSKRSKQNT
ncbi:protein phosphatase 2C 77-like isoform X2 [Bidens hawaiensis]|uniref:protein phosphatase 2C 77-like isoform X2 n=1 Tax=Bidens hawaiensis TaxID=980011 RepID=UPI0040498E63